MASVLWSMSDSSKTTSDSTESKRRTSSGDETRARIVEAALETLKSEGIVGTSARAIARQGDFNQALIFYHFGSVDDLVVAAVAEMSRRRMGNHKPKLESAGSLTELIAIGREIHNDDLVADNMAVLTQAFAGARAKSEIGAKLYTSSNRGPIWLPMPFGGYSTRTRSQRPLTLNTSHRSSVRCFSGSSCSKTSTPSAAQPTGYSTRSKALLDCSNCYFKARRSAPQSKVRTSFPGFALRSCGLPPKRCSAGVG